MEAREASPDRARAESDSSASCFHARAVRFDEVESMVGPPCSAGSVAPAAAAAAAAARADFFREPPAVFDPVRGTPVEVRGTPVPPREDRDALSEVMGSPSEPIIVDEAAARAISFTSAGHSAKHEHGSTRSKPHANRFRAPSVAVSKEGGEGGGKVEMVIDAAARSLDLSTHATHLCWRRLACPQSQEPPCTQCPSS